MSLSGVSQVSVIGTYSVYTFHQKQPQYIYKHKMKRVIIIKSAAVLWESITVCRSLYQNYANNYKMDELIRLDTSLLLY